MAKPPDPGKILERRGAEVVYSQMGCVLPMTVDDIKLCENHIGVHLTLISRYQPLLTWVEHRPRIPDSFWVGAAWEYFSSFDSSWSYVYYASWKIDFSKQTFSYFIELCERERNLDPLALYQLVQFLASCPQPVDQLLACCRQAAIDHSVRIWAVK